MIKNKSFKGAMLYYSYHSLLLSYSVEKQKGHTVYTSQAPGFLSISRSITLKNSTSSIPHIKNSTSSIFKFIYKLGLRLN